MAEPWLRAAELVGVDFPKRIIEVIVMPYEREADVADPRNKSRRATEVISRGAFDGVERRPNRIKANRDHDGTRIFGRALALHPEHEKGLKADIRVAQTALGDETLALAEDGCLEASAGFLPMEDGMRWEGRSRYRVDKAWLHHVALVPDGAYGQDAPVLAVRAQVQPVTVERAATPVLDALELQQWAERLAAIDARWIHPPAA